MELPISQSSYAPSSDALVRAIQRADAVLARTHSVEADLDGATVFTHPDRPAAVMGNFACDLLASSRDETCALLDRIEKHFRGQGTRCAWMTTSDAQTPPDFADELSKRGFVPSPRRVYQLVSWQRPTRQHAGLRVIPARADYPQARTLLRTQAAESLGRKPDVQAAADQWADCMIDQLDEPRIDAYLARLGQQTVGYVGVLSLGQVGVLENLYVHPDHRRQGVARTLLSRAIDHCERALFEAIVVECGEGEQDRPAAALYESAGFHVAGRIVRYVRKV
ncbi:MAG: GNAT family N-acetyltransferase [Phycisphaera sp.]|nr:GNAT family N-acetyltransferase [Phycisphaera sp.]